MGNWFLPEARPRLVILRQGGAGTVQAVLCRPDLLMRLLW
jgi:hypothetical protein